ncbi:hypothetical protein INR49_004289 [Caranx melampygus]|nr:hypothetical protein INR49_004289 [Caranx melampygus]
MKRCWGRSVLANITKAYVAFMCMLDVRQTPNLLLRPKSTPTPTASLSANGVPTEAVDYDRLKQDILDEMRKELSKLKEELIDAIREELGKSSTA